MPANVDGMVREGISAYRAGRKDEARALLLRAVEIDQYNEQAWLWLSAVVESVDEQRTCLENALTINPNNERAKQGLQTLSQKAASSAKSASTQAEDVLASSSFTPTPTPSTTPNPFSTAEDEELPSSIEWEAPAAPPTASSSASSSYRVNEPSSEDYDAWVSNLNLGGSAPAQDAFDSSAMDAAAQFISTPFDEDDDLFKAVPAPADEDDLFSSGPFSASDTSAPFAQTPPPTRTPPPAPRPTTSPASKKGADSLLDEIEQEDDVLSSGFGHDFNQAEFDKLDASEFFQYIPKGVQPTRLPGTRERYPALVIVGLLVVFLLNIGAVALLVTNLTAP
jgi:tetratricopeptide (TPR) repeat protein